MQTAQLIEINRVREIAPWWPFSAWATYRLIRAGKLSCVHVGRRLFLTPELLTAFVAEHTRKA